MIRAKGKIKREKIAAQKELETNVTVVATKESKAAKYSHLGKGEVATKEIVQIFADEIEEIYRELGSPLNRPSAEDKALTLVRDMRIHGGVKFHEQ